MAGVLGRLLIIDDQREFACVVVAIAERLGFTTRILPHTLDFEYVMRHWHPDVVAVRMAMPDHQDVQVLEYLAKARFPGQLLLTGDVSKKALEEAAEVARTNGLTVASVLAKSTSTDQIESALKLLLDLQRAA